MNEDEKALKGLVDAAAGMFKRSKRLDRIEKQVNLMEQREIQASQSNDNGDTEPDTET